MAPRDLIVLGGFRLQISPGYLKRESKPSRTHRKSGTIGGLGVQAKRAGVILHRGDISSSVLTTEACVGWQGIIERFGALLENGLPHGRERVAELGMSPNMTRFRLTRIARRSNSSLDH